jgi:VWFA-related protein
MPQPTGTFRTGPGLTGWMQKDWPMMRQIAGLTFSLAAVWAQTAHPQQPPVVFKSTTRLVQVNVVVHDHKGEPVSDLKKEDFIVSEKGKPQQIAFFSMESSDKLASQPTKLPPNIFSNRLQERTGVPASVTVLLLDSLNTKWEDQTYARKQVVKFLEQVQPQDHIAIYTLGRGLKILHDYTTDASALLKNLADYKGQVIPDLEASERNAGGGADGLDLGPVFGGGVIMEADFYMRNRVMNTLKALEVIANHLSSLQGRKNLIWVSGGFPLMIGFDEVPEIGAPISNMNKETFTDEMSSTIRALNNAGVSVYPVDARGLMVMPGFSAENRTIRKQPQLKPIVPHLDTMKELADRTGGRAFYNTNDIKNAVRQAIDDSKVTYSIGYYPEDTAQDGKFRQIKVKVDRAGANVRYRKGYFAMRPASQDENSRKAEMRSAVWSPLDSTALPLNARVDILQKPSPDTVHVFAQIDPSTITLEQKDDRWVGKLDFVFVQKDDRGNMVGQDFADTINMNLTKDRYLQMQQKGLIYERQLSMAARASILRIVARDTASGSIGSLTVRIARAN